MYYIKYKNRLKATPIEVPEDYLTYTDEQKQEFVDNIVDTLLLHIDKQLPTGINRMNFLLTVLNSSLAGALDTEHYEAAVILRDIIKKLDE